MITFGPRLLVMRHGPAEPLATQHEGDAARRLTPEGRERTRSACEVLAQVVPTPACIYTSPLVRAQETAAELAQAWGDAEPLVTPHLAPGFDRVALTRELAAVHREPLVIVGHEPDLSGYVGWLLGSDAPPRVRFGKGCACLLELARPGESRLLAHYPFDALVKLAQG